ncbi:MAG TPA: hypothetical protein VHC22_32410 [Pirellulales bacterium]|nr:hypothetical protein [Pirellulales bacterium]
MPKKSRAKTGWKSHAQKLLKAHAQRQALEWSRNQVEYNHRSWSAKNPKGTLRDLEERLRLALRQCREIMDRCGEDLCISDHPCIPEPLLTELEEWGNADEECTFSDRESDLEDILGSVEDVAEEVGYEFKVSELKGCQPN